MSIAVRVTLSLILILGLCRAADAAMILTDNGRVEVSVSDGIGGSDADTDFRDSGSGRTRATRDISVGSYSAFVQADSQSPPITPPASNTDATFTGWTLTSLRISRDVSDVTANGFARTEPARDITFQLPGGLYDITYRLAGFTSITNETSGNNSFAQAAIRLVNQTRTDAFIDDQQATADATGFDRTETFRFDVRPGEVFALTVDAQVTGILAESETAAQIDAIVEFEITLVPEPTSLGLLLAGLSVLLPSRRRR